MAYKKKKPKKKISSNAATLTDVQKCINYLKKRYVFRYNTVKKRPEFHRKHEKIFHDVEDEDFRSIRIEMAKDTSVNFQCSRETLKDIIWSNSSWYNFDPFKEWLKSLPKWDGNYHIRKLSSTVKTDDDKYFDWCLRKWLVGFVAGLNGKEAVNQECLFLCGKQGLGKSTWIEHLLPQELKDYYSSGSIDFKDKDSHILLSELAIYNLDEGNSLKPKDIDNLKELITMTKTRKRRAYAHAPSTFVRRCSFCGTANGIKVLNDVTGNRRFLCQNVLAIDYKKEIDLPQVYAEALEILRSGKYKGKPFHYWIDNQLEQKYVEAHNRKFRNESLEEILINENYEICKRSDKGCQQKTATEIAKELMQINSEYRLTAQKIGTMLSKMGFEEVMLHGGVHKWLVLRK